jgi:general secretion pathway protein G
MMSTRRATPRHWTGPNTGTGEPGRNSGRRAPQGFTLIEIIIVFTLIGILVGLGLPRYTTAVKRAREAVLKEDLYQLRKQIDLYKQDKGKFPASLQTLVDEEYLRKIPVDPFTRSAEMWIEVREMPSYEEMLPGQEYGIVDVHSGSEETALDGTIYNTW